MKLITWSKDKKTGISIGLNSDGNLFLGDDKSGFNLKDTNNNRVRLENEYHYYTSVSVNVPKKQNTRRIKRGWNMAALQPIK